MKYFIISQDRQYDDAPIILDWSSQIDVRDISLGRSGRLPARKLFFIRSNPRNTFIDVITFPFLLVTESFRNMIKLYEPLSIFKRIILLDSENKRTQLYFMPILEKVDCLTEGSELNMDRSVMKKAVLDPRRIGERSIFWLDGVKSTYTVVRLDLIESVLRRAGRGIALEEVELKEES